MRIVSIPRIDKNVVPNYISRVWCSAQEDSSWIGFTSHEFPAA